MAAIRKMSASRAGIDLGTGFDLETKQLPTGFLAKRFYRMKTEQDHEE